MTWPNLKTSLVILAAVVVVVAVGLGAYGAYHHKPVSKSPVLSSAKIKEVLNEANTDNIKGQYDAAVSLINQNINQTGEGDRQQLYMALGSTYMNKQDYAQALASYQKADAAGSTFGTTEAVGDAASSAGNKQLAISQYKKCLGMIKSGKAAAADAQEAGVLRSEITSLGGTP